MTVKKKERKKVNKGKMFMIGFLNFEKGKQNLWSKFSNEIVKGRSL